MPNFYTPNAGPVIQGVLATAVADDGTFTVSYPSGYTQANFLVGLNGSGSKLIIDNNDKWSLTDPGFSLTFGSSDITVTNLTGASLAAGSSYVLSLDIEDGNDVAIFSFPVTNAQIANGDLVTDFQPGIAGTIESWSYTVTQPVTTAAKAATLNLEIGTTNVTAGTIALTSAGMTPLGKVIQGAEITGANTITADSKISIEASSVTTFVEGTGVIHIRVRKS